MLGGGLGVLANAPRSFPHLRLRAASALRHTTDRLKPWTTVMLGCTRGIKAANPCQLVHNVSERIWPRLSRAAHPAW